MTYNECTASHSIPALICLAFAHVTTDIMSGLHDAGFDDLRLAHFLQVMRHMSGAGDRPSELARLAGVTPQAIGQTLSELEVKGYITRDSDPGDQRSQRVFWAERGLLAGAALEEHYAAMENRWATVVDQHTVKTTRALLTSIIDHDASAPR